MTPSQAPILRDLISPATMSTTTDGAASTGAKLHFSRFEFKYVLPVGLRDELEKQFQYFVELDPYVAGQKDAKYFVRSLYYDNAAFVNYWEKEEGKKHRQKFRLRTYTNDPSDGTPRFLEIKGRHNNLVFKHRIPVGSVPEIVTPESMAHDRITSELIASLPEGDLREAFRFELYRKSVRPVVLVDYLRRPYVSKYDPEFRLTFDDSLYGTATRELDPGPEAVRKMALPGYTILEVKFRFHMPKWFHRLIQTMELQRVSVSKYCKCAQALGLVELLD